MADTPRDVIAGAIYDAMRRQAENGAGFDAPTVTPAVGVARFNGVAYIDGEIDLEVVADAVIEALSLTTCPHYRCSCGGRIADGLFAPDKPLNDPDMIRAAEEWESRQ